MTNYFNENHNIFYLLSKHRAEIALQKNNLEVLTSGDFEPSDVEQENFTPDGLSAEWVVNSLTKDSKEVEAEIQLQFVASAFNRLVKAMDVIEAQIALSDRMEEFSFSQKDKSNLRRCLKADHYAVRGLYDQIETLREYQKKKNFPRMADEEAMEGGLAVATLRYNNLKDGTLSSKFNRLSTTELLDALYVARMEYVTQAAHDISRTLDKTHNAIREATLIEVSVQHQDGLKSDEFVKNVTVASMKYASDRIKDVEFMVDKIDEFLRAINNTNGKETRYVPLTINGYDQLSP